MNRSLRQTCRAVSAGVLTLALAAGGVAGAVPAEAAASPVLTIEAARASVTVYRSSEENGGGIYGDLGVYAVAGKRAFEVHAKRTSYEKKIVAKLLRPGKDKTMPTPKTFLGLTDFSTTTYTNQAGKVVNQTTKTFCPNSGEPIRRRPNAPAGSPYPQTCNGNPYSLGAVWGIQAGYAASLGGGSYYYGDESLPDLPVGVYRATVKINPAYRKALGISTKRATATVKVTVKPEPRCDQDHAEGCLSGPSARADQNARAASGQPAKLSGKRIKPSGALPDLRSLPAWGIGVEGGRYLNFNATVWNAGPGRLVVDGFRKKNDPDLMNAYQYFFTSSGKQKGYAPVGGMEWDDRDGHDHWHFQDFAVYQLLDARKKFVVRSAKEAFCLANTDSVDYLVKGANWKPDNTDLHTSCGSRGSLGVRQVLDAGSGDTYLQYLPGQSFDLRGLANGTYYIQIKANPDKVLYEGRTSNNTSYRKVVVGGPAAARTVKVQRIGVVDESAYAEEDE